MLAMDINTFSTTIDDDISLKKNKNSIRAIDQRSVHQICSGQVILSLATAVKELVENSIDAGATNVEIKLKEFGIDSIEVHDNGSGIEEKDFEALALKHCTSKLRDFSDLTIVETFGFRGEALSSLCALSKLTVLTRHNSKEFGTKLDFNYDGKLASKTPCARETGTTVIVNQLFHTLPVRHKEFQRNIKKEFPKLSSVLQAYGIISTGVRLSCINVSDKNRKTIVLSTPGSDTSIDNITSIFGPKQVQSLLPFTQREPTDEVLDAFNLSSKMVTENMNIFTVNGYISRIDHGCGRSSLDRQFYFVNKRPCDIAKISRLVNEVYHMFNRHQNPFVFLDISLNSDMVDVNITPDKRQIFVQNEKLLLAILKSSLLHMFTATAGQYEVNSKTQDLSCTSSGKSSPSTLIRSPSYNASSSHESFSDLEAQDDEHLFSRQRGKQNNNNIPFVSKGGLSISSVLSNFRSKFARNQSTSPSNKGSQVSIERFTYTVTREKVLGNDLDKFSRVEKVELPDKARLNGCVADNDPSSPSATISLNEETAERESSLDSKENILECRIEENSGKMWINGKINEESFVALHFDDNYHRDNKQKIFAVDKANQKYLESECESDVNVSIFSSNAELDRDGLEMSGNAIATNTKEHLAVKQRESVDNGTIPDHSNASACGIMPYKKRRFARPEVKVQFDLREFRDDLNLLTSCSSDASAPLLGFHARIAPNQNNAAEEELRMNITKDMFKEMKVIGQFNLGFIIAKINDDLFIIDQHATDEKYNFETLQKEHCLKGQRLIQPRLLELTPVNESIVIDNIEIFQKNGFDFVIDEQQPSGKKIKLVSLPTSRNWTFDVQDIEELIFMLSDSPGVMCRPSRVRSMFASRACRMSTMVGSALNNSQMKTLINHMAEIEHPWNCPHGRPTMRHLVNLSRISKKLDFNSQPEE